jgi:hypothetical protein
MISQQVNFMSFRQRIEISQFFEQTLCYLIEAGREEPAFTSGNFQIPFSMKRVHT